MNDNLRKTLRLPALALALVCVGIMRLLHPLVTIRIGSWCNFRLGHQTMNMENYLNEVAAGINIPKGRFFDLWARLGPDANRQIGRMYNRVLNVVPDKFLILVSAVNRCFAGWERHYVEPAQVDRDIFNLLERFPPHISFTAAEHRRGKAWLRRHGIIGKWVCMIVRDRAYLMQKYPSTDTAYHDYRDSSIENYRDAALKLAEAGYWVLRMGVVVERPLGVDHPRVIDYATMRMNDPLTTYGEWDFMDAYLGAHCEFCLSNSCGFDGIPQVFRRPICYVNFVPLEYLPTYLQHSLAIWKHHKHWTTGKRMTVTEIFESDAGQFLDTTNFLSAKVLLEENTPEEITDAAMEMVQMLRLPLAADERQTQFWMYFPRRHSPRNMKQLQGAFRLRIPPRFLKQYYPDAD